MESIDAATLRAFYHAAMEQNFTSAARRAFMTQSGVSQHIAKLEDQLGTKLFNRVGREVRLTEGGSDLLAFARNHFDQFELLKAKISKSRVELKGRVSYAMPGSCLYTPHFPMLLKARIKHFPNIQLKIDIRPSEEIARGVVEGLYDFGFITRPQPQRSLKSELFAEENYVLATNVTSPLKRIKDLNEIFELRWMTYTGMEDLFDEWVGHSFGVGRRKLPVLNEMLVDLSVESMMGARLACVEGPFVGIFPEHCIEDLLKAGKLRTVATPQPKKTAQTNPIFLIQNQGAQHPERVQKVISTFWNMVRE